MKVSVIVPVYNVEKYLEKCLDSLVNQTLKDIEIIVVNDGTLDNSQDIIDKYKKKYPKKIISIIKENGGQGSARNMGLDIATGEYIGFVDSDDWVNLTMYEKMYEKAIKNKSDVVICDMSDVYSDHKVYYNCTKYDSFFEKTGSACNKIFKKTLINDIRFLPKIWYEDFNFVVKLLLQTNKISTISKDYYYCLCRDGSTMHNNNSLKNLDILIAMDDIIDYSKKNNLYNKSLIEYLIFDHVLITTINRVYKQKGKDKTKVINNLRNYCKKNIKDYKKMDFYNNISRNRKIVAFFNYHGLVFISSILVYVKGKLNN